MTFFMAYKSKNAALIIGDGYEHAVYTKGKEKKFVLTSECVQKTFQSVNNEVIWVFLEMLI